MGKKTNWAVSEDQVLCRAWLSASDSTSSTNGGDQRADTFWNVVHQVFHSEIETSIERPVNGLKIRWTRVNRDMQKFALIYADIYANKGDSNDVGGTSVATSSTGDVEDTLEQECIADAMVQFQKRHGTKFVFESCWRILRFSPKWMRLLATTNTSTGYTDSPSLFGDKFKLKSKQIKNDPLTGSSPYKRRIITSMDATSALRSLGTNGDPNLMMVRELKRHSDLLEEHNMIQLFQLDMDGIEDDIARDYCIALRQRYIKRIRQEVEDESFSDHTPHGVHDGKPTEEETDDI